MSTTRRDMASGAASYNTEAADVASLRARVEALEASVQALEADEADDEGGKDDEEEHVPPTLVEWGVRLLSVAFLATLIGYVLWIGAQPTIPPQFEHEVMTAEIEQRGESWAVPVEIHNVGNESVLELLVVGELVDENDEVVDEAEVGFPLFGPLEREDVEFWFDENPADYEFRFNVAGYSKP